MKAWVTYRFGDMRLEEVPMPVPEPGWVTVRVEVCQPSVTDVQRARGVQTLGWERIKKFVEERAPVQMFGHEFTGRVARVGEGVTAFQEGDRVTARSNIPCGACAACLQGNDALCPHYSRLGEDTPGVFAEYVNVPVSVLAKVPDNVSPSAAACMQPLAAALGYMRSAPIPEGATVAVLGQGVMGLYCLQIARAMGAGTTWAFDVRDESLELARAFGADHVVSAAHRDPIAYIMDTTGGVGVDLVVECAGGSVAEGLAGFKTVEQAFRMVRVGGTVLQVAHPMFGEPLPLNLSLLKTRCIQYVFPRRSSQDDLLDALQLVSSGKVDVQSLITHRVEGLENLPQAFEITANKRAHKALNPAQIHVWDPAR